MNTSLQAIIKTIAAAADERELQLRLMDSVGEYFGAQRWGLYLQNKTEGLSVETYGVSDTFIDRYEKVGRSVDPVLQYVLDRHTPAHEQLVLPPGGWKQSQLYQRCCSYYDHEHIMTGPIVGGGELLGTVHFARIANTPAFDDRALIDLGVVCTHFSACLALLRSQPPLFRSARTHHLTPRELQIAKLVAQGLTNAEIGAQLWITRNSVKQALKRMFRKLEVSARAEMVAQLQDIL